MVQPTQEANELVEEEEGEPAPEIVEVDPERRRIFAQPSDPTVQDLYNRVKDGDLMLHPDFQRYFVWDDVKSSRLIESVVLDVPLPIIYLAEESDGKESVIDGQQRLTSFVKFLDGELKLAGLKVTTDLNGKVFAGLEKTVQNKIRRAAIRTITIQKESDRNLKFDIFHRLNTGSVALNDQELRNCVYRGPYNSLLRELAADQDFMFLLGLQKPEKRMRDVELALRFAAFYHATYLKYHPPMRRFLNDDVERYRHISPSDADSLRRAFKNSVQTIRSVLGTNAFKRFYRGKGTNHNGVWEQKRFNASLYDVLMGGFTRYEKNQVYPHLDSIKEALLWLMTTDEEFVAAIELSTSSVAMVTTRFDKWRHVLEQIVGLPRTEPRCFSHALKDQMFKGDPTCSICLQGMRWTPSSRQSRGQNKRDSRCVLGSAHLWQ